MHTVLNHPLVSHRLSLMRDQSTPPKLFRELVGEVTRYLAYEGLRDICTEPVEVETPIAKMTGSRISDRVVLVPILRAGMGMLDPMLETLPGARVGVLGMQRNEQTAEPVPYYSKVPPAREGSLAIVIDPMLATGGSACDAVGQLKKLGYRRIKFFCIISAPEGIAKFESVHPDVPVFTAAKDERLNGDFYIVPGLGDAGDRIFGTEEHSVFSRMVKVMERKMMADGRIDMFEAGELLHAARPIAGLNADAEAFRKILEEVRADGKVDADESNRISKLLAALADKADACAVEYCPACHHPVSKRTMIGGAVLCPWCGEPCNF